MMTLNSGDLTQAYGLTSAQRVSSETAQDKRIGFIGMRG